MTAEAAGAVPDDVNRLAGMVERHLTALAQVIHTAAEKGSHAAIEEVADYLNGCDAVDPDKDPAAYIAWLARPDTPESSRRQDAAAASDAGAFPDDVIEEVAQAIFADAFMGLVGWDDITEGTRSGWRDQAHAALSVPSVAEVFARDAKVREAIRSLTVDRRDFGRPNVRRVFRDGAFVAEISALVADELVEFLDELQGAERAEGERS